MEGSARSPRGQWQHLWFSREMSLPGLTNHLGSLQIEADPIAIKHAIFPPVSAAEETTGMTWLDGGLFATSGQPVRARWSLAMLEREANFQGWSLRTCTAILPGERAVVIKVELRNPAAKTRAADLRLRLSGRSRNTGGNGYRWAVPAVATSVAALNRPEGHDVVETYDTKSRAIAFSNLSEPCCGMQGIIGPAHKWRGGWIHVPLKMRARQSARFDVLLCYGTDPVEVARTYRRLTAAIASLIPRAEAYWTKHWSDLQSVSRPYATALRKLSPGLRELHATALATATYLRRDYPTTCASRLYLTLFPRRGEGSFYLWDIGMAAPFMARVDVEAVRAMTELAAARIDFYDQKYMNAFTGEGGHWFYAANLWSVFRMAWSVLSETRDFAWLDKKLGGNREGQTVWEMLEELALAWTVCCPGQKPLTNRTRDHGAQSATDIEMPVLGDGTKYPFAVADCGNRAALLEATTTYQYQVASMNAGFVWMMRRLADLHEHRGNAKRTAELRTLARRLANNILRMFRKEDGFFSCGYPDGRIVPSRTGLDHLMVMNCMPEDIPPSMRRALVASFERELRTRLWMRIVSDRDHDVMSGFRSDTTFVGSYAGFVAMMAEGLCLIGQRATASRFLRDVAPITAQGPVGQSYWIETLREPIHGGAAKCTDEMPQGNHWCEMGGVAFGSAIVHGLLGKSWTPFA